MKGCPLNQQEYNMLHFGEGRNKKTFFNPADFIDIPYYFVSGSAVAYNASFHIDFRSIICFNFVKSFLYFFLYVVLLRYYFV